jgi:ArsR family transcriptional regulator, arsenate/arsenite/antimonite-responsive transcriptional repressor
MEEKEAILALYALAQESRLKVFRLLVQAGPEGLAAGAIAEELGIAPATLSFHLAQLTHAGLSVTKREGRSIIYALRVDGIRNLLGFLTKDCCGGRPELCSPRGVPVSLTRPRSRRKERI